MKLQLLPALLGVAGASRPAPSADADRLANTPPMGFNTWNLYHCAVTADILTETATAMVETGLKDSGYLYVNSDDCWMSFNRSATGEQVPDPTKFPKGFKAVADFIHGVGMKSGLYTAKGPHTCQKRVASCLHEAQDAKSWASWGVDYVKDDSCSICNMANGTRYTDMEDYHRMWLGIQASGRPMILTVEGSPPADIITHGGYGNAKRVGHDISPTWGSMISLVDIGAGLWPYAHNEIDPKFGGWWNDLDMIEIGNGDGYIQKSEVAAAQMYPWAVPPADAKSEWTMSADGTARTDKLCLTAGSPAVLTACKTADPTQAFTLDKANGNLHLTQKKGSCLALEGGGGPALTMAPCKSGHGGENEEFTLTGGKLCSKTLSRPTTEPVCLTANATRPPGSHGGGGHHGNTGGGFACSADAASLARCQVHFTMWTIMKAPMLLGNDIRKMDNASLAVVKNKDAIAINQDALGVQAQRVWAGTSSSSSLMGGFSSAAVAAPCDSTRSTQAWSDDNGVLTTTDAAGQKWCLADMEGSEEVGSWRAIPCSSAAGTRLTHQKIRGNAVAVVTPGGAHLTLNNALGASGPVPHSRYLAADGDRSAFSSWLREPVDGSSSFRLMHSDRTGVRDDDKAGSVTFGGDWCLGIANDGDSEVWAGPLADKKWAVALLNRHANTTATITVDYTMFNSTADASFSVKDIWEAKEIGTHKGTYTATVPPQAVSYLILTPV